MSNQKLEDVLDDIEDAFVYKVLRDIPPIRLPNETLEDDQTKETKDKV